jgi:exodeoxyribonuclease VII small subunit
MARKQEQPTFGEAVAEVEQILEEIENDDVDIDVLGEKVKRAVELIQLCRGKLEATDKEVRGLVEQLQADDAAGDAAKDAPF